MHPDEPIPGAETASRPTDPQAIAKRHHAAALGPVPEQIGPYKILHEIGEGGMGIVYLAEQKTPIHRRVALKLVKPGMDTKRVIARFETEREALAMMNHPNVAKVLDAGVTQQGHSYFVMEYVQGIPITDYCDKHSLTARDRLRLVVDVCNAVQHAHQKGIIHRDIKPSNVLVAVQDDQPVVKVIDFGIAKAVQHQPTARSLLTEQGQLLGTPGYMSPEQAEVTALDVDTRTDIYSLGVLAYEMLVGAPPFDTQMLLAAGMREIQRLIREIDPPKPSTKLIRLGDSQAIARKRRTEPRTLVRELRGDLDWVVMKCLEKDRTRRYATANGLAMDLRRYLRNEPVVARPPSTAYRFRKFVQRNRTAVVVLGLSSILLALGVAGTTWGVLRTQAARRDAAQREAEAEAGLQFLTSVLRAADPWRSGGMINARQIVDQASRVISGEVADFPEVQARLMVALGKTYSSLGLPEEARKHLNDALTTQRRLLGDAHPETIESMVQIGNAEVIASNFAEAQAVGERAVAACLGTFGELSQQTRDAMNVVGDALAGLGRMEEAIELRARMYAMADKELGKDSPKTLWQANRLGMLYAEAGRYRDAEELLERVRAAREQVLTASHHSTLRTMYFLAAARRALGRYQEAATLFEQTLLGQRRVLWADHPDTLACAEELAQCWAMLGRLDEACRLQEETLDLYRKAVRDEHERTLAARRALALLHLKAGRWTLANELTEDVLAISRQAMGESHPATHWAMRDRAEVLLAANPPEPQLLQEALDLAQRACSAQEDLRRPDLHKFLVTLAGAQFKTGDIPAAAETLRRAIALAPRDGPLKVDYEGRLGSYEAELGGKTRDPAAPNAVRED